jgi:hypothetical protein
LGGGEAGVVRGVAKVKRVTKVAIVEPLKVLNRRDVIAATQSPNLLVGREDFIRKRKTRTESKKPEWKRNNDPHDSVPP